MTNSVPDNPIEVGYTGPLYKAPPDTRGKMTVQRGPDGTYKLLAAGPDHRRAESRSPDGLVRGTYSFLDDKGIQRTVEYIAGAGIGYRVVKNRVGPGTHVNDQVLDFRLNDASFKLANDFGTGANGGGLSINGGGNTGVNPSGDSSGVSDVGAGAGRRGNKGRGGGGAGGGGGGAGTNRDYVRTSTNRVDAPDENNDDEEIYDAASDTNARNSGAVAKNKGKANQKNGGSKDRDYMLERGQSKVNTKSRNPTNGGNKRKPNRGSAASTPSRNRPGNSASSGDSKGYHYDSPSFSNTNNNYDVSDDDFASALPPLVTANHKILEIDRERDWVDRHRDSTIIKNIGKWYVGLPPGHSVRAHVQNIDILPLHGRRVLSPSEALLQDELADMVASSVDNERELYRS